MFCTSSHLVFIYILHSVTTIYKIPFPTCQLWLYIVIYSSTEGEQGGRQHHKTCRQHRLKDGRECRPRCFVVRRSFRSPSTSEPTHERLWMTMANLHMCCMSGENLTGVTIVTWCEPEPFKGHAHLQIWKNLISDMSPNRPSSQNFQWIASSF